MNGRVADRDRSRSLVTTEDPAQAVLERSIIYDTTPDGDQIWVVLYRVLDRDAAIPGIGPEPAPGWYVSPRLQERALTDAALRRRFPGAASLNRAGIGSADELVAYRVVEPDVELPVPSTFHMASSDGLELIVAADLTPRDVLKGAFVLLGLPLAGLLLAAASASSPTLSRRTQVLGALGAPPWLPRLLASGVGVLASLPGAILAGLIWLFFAPRLSHVPIVQRPVLKGDLAVSAESVLIVVALVTVAAGSFTGLRSDRGMRVRPTMGSPVRLHGRRLTMAAAGVLFMFVGSGVVVGDRNDTFYVFGVVVTAIGSVRALPILLDFAGSALSRQGDALSLLAGRRLSYDAIGLSRGLVAFGTLLVIVPVATILVASARTPDEGVPHLPPPVGASGQLSSGEVAELEQAARAVPLVLYRLPALQDDEDPTKLSTILVGRCEPVRSLGVTEACEEGGAFELTGPVAGGYRAAMLPTTVYEVAPSEGDPVMTLLLSEHWEATDNMLREFTANRDHAGPPALPTVNPRHEAPEMRWIVGGLIASSSVTALALIVQLIAQAARVAGRRTRLQFTGVPAHLIRRLTAAESALVVGISGLASTALGAIAAILYRHMNPLVPTPTTVLLLSISAVAIAALLCSAVAWASTLTKEGEVLRAD